MAIGERIKRIRNFRKLTQAQLGKAVGLSDVRIRQYEIGNRTPKEEMIQEQCRAREEWIINDNWKNETIEEQKKTIEEQEKEISDLKKGKEEQEERIMHLEEMLDQLNDKIQLLQK